MQTRRTIMGFVRIFIFGWIVALLGVPLVAAPAKGQEVLTLEAIFASDRFSGSLPEDILWRPDSRSFVFRQRIGTTDGLWEYGVKSGRRRLIADWDAVARTLAAARPGYRPPVLDDVNTHPDAGRQASLSPDGRLYLASDNGDLFLVDLQSGRPRYLTDAPGLERFAAFSPDGSRVAFTRGGDLYAVEVATGRERRLTDRGADARLLNGEADWVYEEELNVARSFWWSPGSDRILYVQYDVSPIALFPIPDHLDPGSAVELQRYPRAGEANARVKLRLLDLRSGASRTLFDAGASDSYLPRAGWWPDGSAAWFITLNRGQDRLELRTVAAAGAESRLLLAEEDPAFVNVPDPPLFAGAQRFVWASERDGYRHLYLYRRDGTLVRQLSRGPWQVDEVLGLAAHGRRVLFRGNAEDPRESHLYSVALAGGAIRRLAGRRGWHEAVAAPDGSRLLDTFSDLNTPPRLDLVDASGREARTIADGAIPALAEVDLGKTELGSLRAGDGTVLYWSMLRPADFDPLKKYPVLVYVYGGPTDQMVKNAWPESRGLFLQYLARCGLIVFTLDNRGSARRGHAFEAASFRRLGQVELADQVLGATYLESLPYVDRERIGVYGGSYGGTMTLMCMNKAPEHFRVGVAYAPVVDWALYDTVYTERYMDRPQDNPDGYREGAPLHFASGLAGPLLICHGTADNNVHLQNTVQMAGEYVKAGKLFELMLYPRIRHGIRMSKYKLQFHALKADFLERYLIRGGPR
jgi:dipeptidyl-peptidase-4